MTAKKETDPEFYEKVYKQINAYIRKLTSNSEHVDEVTQEVFLKIHHSIGTLKDKEKLTSWLHRIVYTTLMDYYKKQKQFSTPIAVLETQQESINKDNPELIACILELLQLLPSEQRELLKAIEIDGMKQTEYAKTHNINVSTVKSRLQRAKQRIKEQILLGCRLETDSYGNIIDYQLPKK